MVATGVSHQVHELFSQFTQAVLESGSGQNASAFFLPAQVPLLLLVSFQMFDQQLAGFVLVDSVLVGLSDLGWAIVKMVLLVVPLELLVEQFVFLASDCNLFRFEKVLVAAGRLASQILDFDLLLNGFFTCFPSSAFVYYFRFFDDLPTLVSFGGLGDERLV